jgi:hypothetical protein
LYVDYFSHFTLTLNKFIKEIPKIGVNKFVTM